MDRDSSSDQQIREILSLSRVAVIGMSKNPSKSAHYVPKYLADNGYNITPVNPTTDEILEKNVIVQSLKLMVTLISLMFSDLLIKSYPLFKKR